MAWYDYVPGVSNVAGAVKGDWGQAALGAPYGAVKDLQGQASSPYNQASAGIMGMAPQIKDFSNTQWNRQMQGLGGALGQYDPSSAWFNNSYGSSGPGAMENAFANSGQKYMNPTQSSGALGQYQNYMNQSPLAYQYGNIGAGLAGNQVDYSQYQNQLNGPGQANQFYARNQSGYSNPGAGENWFAQNGQNFNNEPMSMQVYDQSAQQLYGQGRAETFAPQNVNSGASYQQQQAGRLDRGTQLDKSSGEVSNYARNANDVSNYAGQQMGNLSGPGIYEQFVQSDINGTNPELQQAKQEGLASINQEMARRGHFNSGGADTAIGKFAGNIAAQDYQNRANRAQSAQQMELGRIGQGQGLAQASAQSKLAQGGALQSIAGAQDSSAQANEALRLQAAQLASNERMANNQMGLSAATSADAARNARLNTLSGLANTGDQTWLAQQNAAGNLANRSQSSEMARLQGGMGASNTVDQTGLAQLMAQYGMANQGNDQNLARGQYMTNTGLSLDQNNLARYGQLGNMSNMADTQGLGALNSYFNQAGNAQTAEGQRMRDSMQAIFGLNNAQAGQYGNFYGQGGQLSGNSFSDYINAMANAYGLQAKGGAAGAQVPFQLANLGIQGGKMFTGAA